jgi:hypothetical protein
MAEFLSEMFQRIIAISFEYFPFNQGVHLVKARSVFYSAAIHWGFG